MLFNRGVSWWRSAFTALILSVGMADGCPNMCTCKWKGGKEWVECAGRQLKALPQGAREETQVLDLSNNHLTTLAPESFHALGLVNLQRLYLSKSHINRIDSRAFVGLVGLVELDLSENLIEEIPTETFASYPNLMRLILNGNPIRKIRREAFGRLEHLTNLELSQCRVELVEEGAFSGLLSLEWLRLNGNRLTHVPDHTLPLGGSLRGLTLHNNPWLCDCKLRSMQTWLKESAPAIPQESEPICSAPPRLRGKQIKAVKTVDLACLPQINLEKRLEIYEGTNATLRCDVHAIPPAKVTWWFNGDPFEPQKENDSLSITSTMYPRYTYKQRGLTNMTSSFYVYGVEAIDDGTYTCVAENSAGSAEANLSLRVLFREKITVEPPFDNPATGYIATIAAGALVGTLFALGCLVGSIVFCVRRHRRERKRNSKSLASQNKSVLPITKDSTSGRSCRKGNGDLSGEQEGISYTEREINRAVNADRREHCATGETYEGSSMSKHLTEPDLINEVLESTDMVCGQLHSRLHLAERQIFEYDTGYTMQPDLRPLNVSQVSYLDQDGYPLNFGLPKISYTASTLPRLRTRMAEGSAVAPPARYSREAEFLARSTGYDPVLGRTDARYTAEGYPYPAHQPIHQPVHPAPLQQVHQPVHQPIHQSMHQSVHQPVHQPVHQHPQTHQPTLQAIPEPVESPQLPVSPVSPVAAFPEVPFIPSPPAAYRGETTPLSPRSLLSKTAREAAAAAAARANEEHPPHHPESPDEGYVGDAMDV
ncbi:leucine-rich repeat-containing protein 24-like [Prorops nasuta]|uniref:leucine-rich repeat-containing protein 24-like n=1 Tax=Prorops nasuta TaxID=863751 RepID=UPI0034CDF982